MQTDRVTSTRMLFLLLSLILGLTRAQMPPSSWLDDAQKANCANIVPANVHIFNDSRSQFDVFWVRQKTQEVKQITNDPVKDKALVNYNTHVDQFLELHEVPDDDTGECNSADQTCRRAFVKAHSDVKVENVYILTPSFEVVRADGLQARAFLGEVIQSDVEVVNEMGGGTFDVYYAARTGEKTKMTSSPLTTGASIKLTSYVNNEFEMQETGACASDNSCRTNMYQNPGGNPSISINENFEVVTKGLVVPK